MFGLDVVAPVRIAPHQTRLPEWVLYRPLQVHLSTLPEIVVEWADLVNKGVSINATHLDCP